MAGEAARLLPPVLLVLLAPGSWEQRIEFLHATEGETISVTCKYRSWEDFSREKIWCRWTSAPECTRLVSTSRWPLVAQETRYVIRDNQLSGTFTVTMTKLRKTDSGSYSCVIKSWSSQSILKIIHLTVSPASTLPATTSRATTTARASTISPAVDRPPDNSTSIIPAVVVAVLLLLALTVGVILYLWKARRGAEKGGKEPQHIYENLSAQKATAFSQQAGFDEDTGDIHYASLTHLSHVGPEDSTYANTHPTQRPTPDPFLSVEYASIIGKRPWPPQSPALEGEPRH